MIWQIIIALPALPPFLADILSNFSLFLIFFSRSKQSSAVRLLGREYPKLKEVAYVFMITLYYLTIFF